MADDGIARHIEREVKERFERRIEIPDGLTEDEAVASVIAQYRAMTDVELAEEDVRAEVRQRMAGRDTT